MGVYEGRGQLAKGLKELMSAWMECKSSWRDQNAERFEKKHIIPLEMDMRAATSAMDQMSQLLAAIKRDCE
jgi:CII-binding regulator of phage lambda lysogenization HflD